MARGPVICDSSSSGNYMVHQHEELTIQDSTGAQNMQLAGRLNEKCGSIAEKQTETATNTPDVGGAASEVDRRKGTVELIDEAKPQPWIVKVHIDSVTNQGVLNGISRELEYFPWNTTVIMGRGEDVDIFLSDETVSRSHVGLTGHIIPNSQAACFTATNLSRTKSIHINGREMLPKMHESVVVQTGDRIKVVSVTFKFEIIPGSDINHFAVEFVFPSNQLTSLGGVNNTVLPVVTGGGGLVPGFYGSVYVPPMALQQLTARNVVTTMPLSMPLVPVVPVESTHTMQRAATFDVSPRARTVRLPAQHSMPEMMVVQEALPVYGVTSDGSTSSPRQAGQMLTTAQRSFDSCNNTLYTLDNNSAMLQDALNYCTEHKDKGNYVGLDCLRYLAQEIAGVWKQLGRALGLPEYCLTMIDHDYKKHYEKCYQMLVTWFCTKPSLSTYETLASALCDKTVECNDLADKYCPSARMVHDNRVIAGEGSGNNDGDHDNGADNEGSGNNGGDNEGSGNNGGDNEGSGNNYGDHDNGADNEGSGNNGGDKDNGGDNDDSDANNCDDVQDYGNHQDSANQ